WLEESGLSQRIGLERERESMATAAGAGFPARIATNAPPATTPRFISLSSDLEQSEQTFSLARQILAPKSLHPPSPPPLPPRAGLDQTIPGHDLRPDESARQIRMDLAGCVQEGGAGRHLPRPHLGRPGGEEGDETYSFLGGMEQEMETRFGDPELLAKRGPL